MKKIRIGDTVIVTTGRSKGEEGEIISFPSDEKVIVSKVNMVKKTYKDNPNKGQKAGFGSIESPIHISNVAIVNKHTGKKDKIIIKKLNGKNHRYYASNNELVDESNQR